MKTTRLLLTFVLLPLALPVCAERLALVIGNDGYANAPRLSNARSDAETMSRAFEASGFRVTRILDAGRTALFDGIQRFVETVRPSDEVVVFYGGHAVEFGGTNYLLPTDIRTDNDRSVQYDAMPLPHLLQSVALQQPRFSLVIVDACRDNPFAGRTRNIATRGLMPAGSKGQIVIYSASAGQKALDGLFAQVFAKEIEKSGVVVQDVMRRVKSEVKRRAGSQNHEQQPAVYDESDGDYNFYFRGGARVAQATPDPEVPPQRCAKDEALWAEASRRDTVQAYDGYLAECETGRFVPLARAAKQKLAAPAPVAPPPAVTDTPMPGRTFRDCADCPEMVVVPGGVFEMGSPNAEGDEDEHPPHAVRVRTFALGRFEVTQDQWLALMGTNPSGFRRCGDQCPVEQISWEDANVFIAKLNRKVGGRDDGPYRLPTEAEWEYACKSGGREPYCGSTEADAVAWHSPNSSTRTHPVGRKAANRFGLHDMSGNVSEWVEDCWNENYRGAPADGSAWTGGECQRRVARGGAWFNEPANVRAADRAGDTPARRDLYWGVRVAKTMP